MERLDLTNNRENTNLMAAQQKYVDAYAEEGLRTLFLSKKKLDKSYYEDWTARWEAAMGEIIGKDEKVEAVQSEIESNMVLVGSTAIEDRLQDDVKETIEAFKETGIKVWVLTGDKVETAINIGYSCGLLSNDMEQYIINTVETSEISEKLKEIQLHKTQGKVKAGRKEALIIAGDALTQV